MPNTYAMHEGKRVTMELDQVGVSADAPEWAVQQWNVTLRHGKRIMMFPYYGGGLASEPSAGDVVEDLESNADTLNRTFEDWALEFGYDPDSRSAERTFRACRDLGERFVILVERAQPRNSPGV